MKTTSTIVGSDGKPIERDLLKREIAEAQLTGTRSVWSHGSVASFMTPVKLSDVLARAAIGDMYDFLTFAEEIEERDLHYGSVLGTRKRACSGIEHEIVAASDSAHDEEIAQDVRNMIETADLPDVVEDALDALGKGFSCTEIIWGSSARQWWPERLEWRDPRFFKFDEVSGKQLLLLSDEYPMGSPLPAYKFITHLPRIKCGLPIRGGLARMVAVAYMCKSIALTDWMAFAELFGMPIRIGKYGSNATPAEKATLRNAVANIGSDAAAIIPESMKIELVAVAQNGGGEAMYKTLCEFLDRQISKGVLGQTSTADAQNTGIGSNNASVHNDVRDDIQRADLRQLAKTLNRDVIRPYVDFNYGPQERYPQLQFPIAEPEDIAVLTNALEKLVPMGLKVGTNSVREKLGVPEPREGEDLLHAPGAGTKPAADSSPEKQPVETALNREQSGSITERDQLADEASQDWKPQMQPLLDPLRQLAEQSETAEEFMAGLPELLEEMDDAELVRQLALGFFKARALGEFSAS